MIRTIACIVILILVLNGLGTSAQQSCVATDGTVSGQRIDDMCSCYSGYASGGYDYYNCTVKVPPGCTFNPTSTLATNYIPELVEEDSFIQNNILRVVLQSALVTDRLNASIRFVTADSSQDNSQCSYPGPYWKKDVSTCNDMFIFEVTLAELTGCGWTRTEDAEYIYLTIAASVGQLDKIGELRDEPITRLTESTIRIQLRFPKSLTIYSDIQVSSAVNLLAAITYQAVDAISFQGRIELVTSLQWPFEITQVHKIEAPGTIGVTASIVDMGCTSSANTVCQQKIIFQISPNGACQLTGDYNFGFKIGCRNGELCPLDETTNNATINTKITSEDFCNALVFDIDLSGTLNIFQDATHLQPKTAFMDEQEMYFLVTVSSTKAVILTTNTTGIYFKPPSTLAPKQLLVAGVPTSLALDHNFVLDKAGQSTASFQLTTQTGASEDALFTVTPDSIAEFQFFAEVEVTWAVTNTFGSQQRRARFVLQGSGLSGSQTKMFATPVNIASFKGDAPIAPILPLDTSAGWIVPVSAMLLRSTLLLAIL